MLVQRAPQFQRHIVGRKPPEKVSEPNSSSGGGKGEGDRRAGCGPGLFQRTAYDSTGILLGWRNGGG